MKVRWGVLISGNGSTLQSLLDCRDLCDMAVIISSKATAYGVLRARRAGVPVEVLPAELKGSAKKAEAEQWIIETLKKYNAQKIFLAGYMRIVSPTFIKEYEGRIYNIHPSLLPKYKGLDSFQAAIDAGECEAGATVHHVVADVDAGEIITQRCIDIPAHRESGLSHLWLHINEQRLIRESMRRILWQNRLT